MYAHVYSTNTDVNPEFPYPGTKAKTLCGITHRIPSREELKDTDICPDCESVSKATGID